MYDTKKKPNERVYGKAAAADALPARARMMRPGSLALAALLLGLACASVPGSAEEAGGDELPYRLGSGLRVPGTGLRLGGYATASFENPRRGPSRTALDNASLFVWWEGAGRWKFFGEFDYENVLSSRDSMIRSEDRYLSLERIYFDYALSNTTSLRMGKFLTPIGRWNLVHATPLVWTSSRPLITTQSFPTNVTGLMLTKTWPEVGNGVEFSVYGSSGQEIRPDPDQDTFSSAVGAHLTIPFAREGQLGFSYASFEQENARDERKQLAGIDFLWSYRRFEVSAEAVYRFSDKGSAWDEKGAFAQVAIPLFDKLFAVGRYEVLRQALAPADTKRWVGGLNYHVTPGLVLKAEWISSRNNYQGAPEGFVASVAVLF